MVDRGQDFVAAHQYLAFKFVHLYPRWNMNFPDMMTTRITGRISVKKFYRQVIPVLMLMSTLVDEVHWSERLDPFNHGSHFLKKCFTTIFDGSNIDVSNVRSDRDLKKALFSGSKYNHCCFKFMIGIMFTGVIVHFTGKLVHFISHFHCTLILRSRS